MAKTSVQRPVWRLKDLAVEMDLHPRTVKRWWKKLNVPPDKCAGNGCHRWSQKAVEKLLKLWLQYTVARTQNAYMTARPSQRANWLNKLADSQQFKFDFNAKVISQKIDQKISLAQKAVARQRKRAAGNKRA